MPRKVYDHQFKVAVPLEDAFCVSPLPPGGIKSEGNPPLSPGLRKCLSVLREGDSYGREPRTPHGDATPTRG